MKRDMDLARAILMEIENCDDADGSDAVVVTIDGHTEREIAYHVKLLSEAGLLEARDLSASELFVCLPVRLTWFGHEFIDATRKESLWQKAKNVVLEKTGGLTFEAMKMVVTQLLRDAVFSP